MVSVRHSAALVASWLLAATAIEGAGRISAGLAEEAIASDDDCGGGSGADGAPDSQCALSMLQARAFKASSEAETIKVASAEAGEAELSSVVEVNHSVGVVGIWHYAQDCWHACHGAGMCEWFCGPSNACCRYMRSGDPPECAGVRFWPVLHVHTCVKSPIGDTEVKNETKLIYRDPALFRPSSAEMFDFYMYRVQSNEEYDPENQDMGNLAGIMWYLHNEIVWHPKLKRSGTYFDTPKTRVEKFRVQVRATEVLRKRGMNFGVVNTFDSTKCTGPFSCTNFAEYGFTVGCETWEHKGADFPHTQWVRENKYPGATWYSLPGPCPSKTLKEKTASCIQEEPGGACPESMLPTGTGNCTYRFEKVGELSINEIEGLTDPQQFVNWGGQEYNKKLDRGVYMDFWNGKKDRGKNEKRMEHVEALFRKKYPDLPHLTEPKCNFNKYEFYPHRRWR